MLDDDDSSGEQESYWQCRSCTFSENKQQFLACFLCNVIRPRGSLKAASTEGDNKGLRKTVSLVASSKWSCQKCTFAENESHLSCCFICGTPRQRMSATIFGTPRQRTSETMFGKQSQNSLIEEEDDAEESSHTGELGRSHRDSTEGRLQALAEQLAPKDPYISHLTKLGDIVSLLRLASRVSQDIASTTDDQQILANWVLMVLARDEEQSRKLLLQNGAFGICSEILFQKAKSTSPNVSYALKALVASTMVFLLPNADHDILHYMKIEIKEAKDFLCHQCSKPIKVGLSLPVITVAELKAAGAQKVAKQKSTRDSTSKPPGSLNATTPEEWTEHNTKAHLMKLCSESSDTTQKLTSAAHLLKLVEKEQSIREEMVALDAFDSLLTVVRNAGTNEREVRVTIAAMVAYILKGYYPRTIPLSQEKRDEIKDCIQALAGTEDVAITDATTIYAKTMRRLRWQAQNYLSLYRSTSTEDDAPIIPRPGQLSSRQSSSMLIKPRLQKRQSTACSEIETAAYFLGSSNVSRVLDAVVALIKVAKERPTQRAIMYNFGLQEHLVAIMTSPKMKASKLQLLAAIAFAYILPSLDATAWGDMSTEMVQCMNVLRSNLSAENFTVHGMLVCSQEIQFVMDGLGKCTSSQNDYELNLSIASNTPPPIPSNWDIEELFRERSIAKLVDVIRSGSCRSLDALFLLVVLAPTESVREELRDSGGVNVLCDIFVTWTATSEEMRGAAAIILSCVMTSHGWDTEEQRIKMQECDEFLNTKASLIRRIATKAGNNAKHKNLEPTTYNYCSNEGLMWAVVLNSLGVAGESQSWLWADIATCKLRPPPSTALVLVLKNKEEHVFNVFNLRLATQMAEDITDRLRIHRKQEQPLRDSSNTLIIPKTLDISKADRPEFLGVSVYHLVHHFLPKVEGTLGFSSSSKFYELENLNNQWGFVREHGRSSFCPIDGREGAAYVHTLKGADHVGLANHMLSWTWSYTVRDLVGTLDSYCHANNIDPKRCYVWICCLCINQWRVVESNKSGIQSTHSTVDFESEFRGKVVGIGRILVLMRPWGDPENLKRIWCIFEIFIGLITDSCDVFIVMPRKERDQMAIQLFSSFGQSTGAQGVDSLFKVLQQIDLEKAKASVEKDRKHILELIREKIGFQTVNRKVRNRLRSWVRDMIDSVVQEREDHEEGSSLDDHSSAMNTSKLSYGVFLKQAGDLYQMHGDFSTAQNVYKKCLNIRERILGLDHLGVAEIHSSIGQILFARGSYNEALDNLMKAMRIRQKLLAKNHLQMAKTYFVVGKLLHEMGDVEGALAMMDKCLGIQKGQLGRHRETATTYAYMGLLLGESTETKGRELGLEMARDAQSILEESVGPEHPDTAFCYSTIGSLLHQSDPEGGLNLMKLSCNILEEALGTRHPSLQNPCCRLGEMLQQQGMYEEALYSFRRVQEILEETLGGTNHIAVARVYAQISVVLQLVRESNEAQRAHDQVMTILETCENSNQDQKLVLVYLNAGESFYKEGDPKASFVLFRRGLDVKGQMMLGSEDPADLAACYVAIDSVEYNEQGDSLLPVLEACRRCLSAWTPLAPPQLVGGVTTKWLEQRRRSL